MLKIEKPRGKMELVYAKFYNIYIYQYAVIELCSRYTFKQICGS